MEGKAGSVWILIFGEVKKEALAEPHAQPALTTLGGEQLP
jgi:hypothetical protein